MLAHKLPLVDSVGYSAHIDYEAQTKKNLQKEISNVMSNDLMKHYRVEGEVDDALVTKTAEKIIQGFKLDNPPINPEDIAESLGINVVYANFTPESSEKLHGLYDSSGSRIIVNTEDTALEKVFTIAHELAHALFHDNYAKSEEYVPRYKNEHGQNRYELQADLFAKTLLVPKSLLDRYSQFATKSQLSSMFMVRPELLSVKGK